MIIYHNLQSVDQNLLRQLFEYQDGNLFWKIQPTLAVKIGDSAGYKNHQYICCNVLNKRYRIHRLIFLWHYGYMPKMIDHVDGNTFNNRIENLRECNTRQNAQNMKLTSRNTSGVKGVSWYTPSQKWKAQLSVNGKVYNLGYYLDKEEATKAVREFREKHHGEFVNHG
jgi:hypothetical protein